MKTDDKQNEVFLFIGGFFVTAAILSGVILMLVSIYDFS